MKPVEILCNHQHTSKACVACPYPSAGCPYPEGKPVEEHEEERDETSSRRGIAQASESCISSIEDIPRFPPLSNQNPGIPFP